MDRSLAGRGPGEPVSAPIWRRRSSLPPTAGGPPTARGRAMCTGTGIFLIVAGAVLRFAVAAGSWHGPNVHVVGVVLILAGVLGLLLSLLVRGGPLNRRRLTRSIRPGGYEGSRVAKRKRAAAANVAAVQEDDRFFSPETPGRQNSNL
jgi:hypothetical protein